MADDTSPSLLDPQARGGAIAREGFRFQSELAIARIPFWVTRSSFVEMIAEAMGDVEARFFSLELGTAREFAEYKNHAVTPAEFWHEVEHFAELEAAHPGAYFRFTLLCPGVAPSVVPVVLALQRLRPALPFYDDVQSITDRSITEFVKVVEGQGKSADLARFLLARVVVDTDPPRSVPQGLERFRTVLEEQFPIFNELGSAAARSAYNALAGLLESRIGAVVTRAELLDALWSAAPGKRPVHDVTVVKTLTAREPLAHIPVPILVDLSAFTGGHDRTFPPPAAWDTQVVIPLARIATWLIDFGRERRIYLEGHRRLSAAFACGAVFSAVLGFTITTDIRGEQWQTDAHPVPRTPDYTWDERVVNDDAGATAMAVAIGVLRDPSADVATYLAAHGLRMPLITLVGHEAISSPEQLNSAVRTVKTRIARFGIRKIHLFMAVPSQFGLFLGHRANSLGRIQCYEFTGNSYAESCIIEAR